jgi:hypothetical protein
MLRGGDTEESQKVADGIFEEVVALLGVGFAISGIYSVPYITKNAMKKNN